MENQTDPTKTELYSVYDEMAYEDILETNNLKLAHDTAYNYQSVIIDNTNGRVIKDYSYCNNIIS